MNKIKKFLNKFYLDRNEKEFIRHNKKIFIPKPNRSKPLVLMELNESSANLISYSYMASILEKKYDATIYSFIPNVPRSFFKKSMWEFRRIFGYKTLRIFKSFGTDRLIIPSISGPMKIEVNDIFQKKISFIKTKDDLENLTIFGILFGDLIYDYYLNYYKEPEIDLSSKKFRQHLRFCIGLIVFWNSYIKNNDVKAISVSHTVYSNAIPSRIANNYDLPSYQTTVEDIFLLTKDRFLAYTEFKDFRSVFENLPANIKRQGMSKAKERVEARFSGKVGVDMSYSKKSAFGNKLDFRLIKKSSNIKILVAPHCFFDSPHPFGNNLFPDVLEWLKELVEISKITNYDWYVKTHPDFLQATKDVVDNFFRDEPNFTILPSNSSHNQIIDEGINFALTMYGSIGFEYAAKNIPVINASLNNPHIAYDFNINPKSRAEYIDILMKLESIEHPIVLKDVYEYYFMKNIYYQKSWLFHDHDEVLNYVGGYHGQFTSLIFKYWLETWNIETHNNLLLSIELFIDSKEYKLDSQNLYKTT